MPGLLNPVNQHNSRFLDLVVPLLLLPAALVLAHRPSWIERTRSCLVGLTATFLLAQSLWQISATWQWHGYVGALRETLASHAGPVLPSATPGRPANFDWLWANPSLSIAVNQDGKVNSILLPQVPALFVPFDPFVPGDLPKLERYGIDYSGYLTALADLKLKLRTTHSYTNSPALKQYLQSTGTEVPPAQGE
jgi:hypothetical protein